MYDKVLSGLQCVNPVFRQCPSKIFFLRKKEADFKTRKDTLRFTQTKDKNLLAIK